VRLRLALVTLAALVLAPAVQAKMCVRISAPETAPARQVVAVRVTTLMPTWANGKLVATKPADMGGVRITVRAAGPGGEELRLRLRRSAVKATFVGRIAFPVRGTWTLHVQGWEYAPRDCAKRARIVVR